MPLGQPHSRQRAFPVALTIGLHLALLVFWRFSTLRHPPKPVAGDTPAIEWIKDLAKAPPPSKPARPLPTRVATAPAAAPARAAPAPPPPVIEQAAPVAAAPATSTPAEGVMQRALRDVGKIDKELRRQSPGGHMSDAPAMPNAKLVAGIEKATRAPKAWEAPRIESVQDQGGYDRRIYKVTTATGVYCIYKESNHAPDGLDVIKRGVGEKLMSCPREE
jgi:hypothetical protein